MNYSELKNLVEAQGFTFFDRGTYNLNLVGVRTANDGANTFNDLFYVAFRDYTGAGRCLCFAITTDPGVYYRENPLNPKGTGIVAHGQHQGAWKLGEHKGEAALVQAKPMAVYRDNDGDADLDFNEDSVECVMGGFNCHKSSKTGTSTVVGKWSAGCQVFANCDDHDVLLALARRAAVMWGDSFTYTLLSSDKLGA